MNKNLMIVKDMNSMVKIGIVIPTPTSDLNTKLLTKALSSLIKFKDPKHEYKLCVIANNWTGFSTPVNLGLKQVQDCDYVLIMNDDVEILGTGWEDSMLSGFGEHVGIVGHYKSAQHWKYSAMWFTMIKKEVFDCVGFLDESMNLFSQDIDFGYKAAKEGFMTAFVDAPVLHAWSQSTNRLDDVDVLKQGAKDVFEKKWGIKHDEA